MADVWFGRVIIILSCVFGSGGLGLYLQSRDSRRSATTRLLMGVVYDKITTLGITYIDRGWVTKDEYEELRKYLYEPYKALGGNGVAERVMNGVSRLPLRSHNEYSDIFRNRQSEGYVNNVRLVSAPEQDSSVE
jgi:hypothetical protein